MEHVKLFESVKNSFNGLWQYKLRGESLEIITPYSTTNDMFISVFLTERNNEFIVSDGGWLSDGTYYASVDFNDDCYTKLYYHYESYFDIKSTVDRTGNTHYYKKTYSINTVSNIVYELANFVSAIVSSSFIQFQDIVEKEQKEFFTREANSFIESIAFNNQVRHNYALGDRLKNIRFSSIITYPKSRLVLVNYITGSNYNYFQSSIARANLNFEIASKSLYKDLIHKKIALINDKAEGFKPDKLYEYLNTLETHVDTPNIKWSERGLLTQYI